MIIILLAGEQWQLLVLCRRWTIVLQTRSHNAKYADRKSTEEQLWTYFAKENGKAVQHRHRALRQSHWITPKEEKRQTRLCSFIVVLACERVRIHVCVCVRRVSGTAAEKQENRIMSMVCCELCSLCSMPFQWEGQIEQTSRNSTAGNSDNLTNVHSDTNNILFFFFLFLNKSF